MATYEESVSESVTSAAATTAAWHKLVTDGVISTATTAAAWHKLITDGVVATDSIDTALAVAISEVLSILATPSADGSRYALAVSETVSIRAKAIIALIGTISETIDLTATETVDVHRMASLVEQVLITDTLSTHMRAVALVAVSVALTEIMTAGKGAAVSEGVSFTADLVAKMNAYIASIEQVFLTAAASAMARLTVVQLEGIGLSDETETAARLRADILEGVVFSLALTMDGETYTGWVMNTKNFAVTEYQNFPFNSFCKIGSAYLGANSEGLYVLEGADDAGVNIDATFSLGVTDFGSDKLKELDSIYLGFKLDGGMLVKTISEDGVERVYTVTGDTTKLHTKRVHPLAKGLRAMNWQLELANVDGEDFEINTVEFMPIVLSRRVR